MLIWRPHQSASFEVARNLVCSTILLALIGLSFSLAQVGTQSNHDLNVALPTQRSPCPRALKINTNYQFRGSLHFICLQVTSGLPQLEVIQYYGQQTILSVQVDEVGVNQLASFVDDDGTLRILVAVANRVNGTSMYSIDRFGNQINEKHSVNSQFVSSMAVWRLQLNLEWHLATANQPVYPINLVDPTRKNLRIPSPTPLPIISIHSWRSSYFDSYQKFNLPYDGHVNKLEPMQINGQEFLVVAMDSNRPDQPGLVGQSRAQTADSLVYKLDFSDGNLNWLEYQTLNTKVALDVRAFWVSHRLSLHRDYYIALLGQPNRPQQRPIYGQFNPTNNYSQAAEEESQYGLHIYKYFGDKFMRTHSIAAANANRLDAISYGTGDSYVVIALMSGWTNTLTLYIFDGLALKSIPSPNGLSRLSPLSAHFQGQRQRRTMDSAQLHLFLVPQTGADNATDTSTKRELDVEGDSDQLTLPALATSLSDDLEGGEMSGNRSEGSDTSDSVRGSVYYIPVANLTVDDLEKVGDSNESYQKRTLGGDSEYLLSWCKSTIRSILNDTFEYSSQLLSSLPRVNQHQPIEIHGDLVIDSDLYVSNILYANRIEEGQEMRTVLVADSPSNFSSTFDQIHLAQMQVDELKQKVDQILVDDGSNQDVFSSLTFDTLVLECPNAMGLDPRMLPTPFLGLTCPQVNAIITDRLNSRDIRNISTQALLTGRSMTVARDVRFEHLVLKGQVDILGTLNGINVNEIVFKRGPPTGPIDGSKKFLAGLFSASSLLVDSWNGIHVDTSTYLTSTTDQRIETNLRFTQLVLDTNQAQILQNRSSRFERLNGLYLDLHLDQIAQADGDNTFQVPLHFDELILNGPVRFTASSRIASVDLENLWLNTMFKQSNQNVSAPMEFAGDVHISYGGDVLVAGLINGIELAPGMVVMRNGNYTLTNPVVFEHDLAVANLSIEKALNGIQVVFNSDSSRYELAILLNGGTQYISGDKVFTDIKLAGQNTISGNINGHLNLTQLYSLTTQSAPFRFNRLRLVGKDIRLADRANIHIVSTVNGFDTNNLCEFATRLSQRPFIQLDRLKFDHLIEFKSLRCAAINGFTNLTNSFLTKRGNQHIAGTLRLTNGALMNTTVSIRSSFNDFNIAPLTGKIATVISESRTGEREWREDLVVDELIVDRINDLQMSNVFLARSDSPQIVRAPLIFDHLDIENILVVGQNIATNSFNGLNVTDMLTNTLQYDNPQVIYNHVELNTVQLLAGTNLLTKSLNGHDLARLYADAVLLDVPQQIIAPKTFRSPIDFERVYISQAIDGLNEAELRFNLLLHSDELIVDDLEFNNDVFVRKELEIQTGMINDIDIGLFVKSMLYENGPNGNGLRLVGNGSVRFKDVHLNNLVVAGTIQGVDLSRDAILKQENLNGSYNARIRREQLTNNNQRLIESLYGPGSSFNVQSKFRGAEHSGVCFVHSCARSTLQLNASRMQSIWRPSWSLVSVPGAQPPPLAQGPPVDQKLVEYKSTLQAQAIMDLSMRVNKYLSISFYYDIIQQQQLLGPILHAANNPILSEEGSSLLFLKATSKPGEPCLQKGQTIAVMARQNQRTPYSAFTLSSRIQETSDPIAAQSVDIDSNIHYLFILDARSDSTTATTWQLIIYLWDYRSGMYEQRDRIPLDSPATAMRAFVFRQTACVLLANPRLIQTNHSGFPTLYCQTSAVSTFQRRFTLPIANVFDLDIVYDSQKPQLLVAALSQQDAEQIGDLTVGEFDLLTGAFVEIAVRRTVKPIKLHLFRNGAYTADIHLVVAEAITSRDNSQAITRIFSIREYDLPAQTRYGQLDGGRVLNELQVFKDSQFYDIQSVKLSPTQRLLFLQSAHSIAIYASSDRRRSEYNCLPGYSLLQKIPTNGANKFLVFNDHPQNSSNSSQLFAHFLVLSTDNCEQQKIATTILRSIFK